MMEPYIIWKLEFASINSMRYRLNGWYHLYPEERSLDTAYLTIEYRINL